MPGGGTAGGGIGGFEIFSAPDLYTWVVPEGVTKLLVEAWGAGGGGAEYVPYTSVPFGGGGGGGGYVQAVVSVTPGTTMGITVGAGGPGNVGEGEEGAPPGSGVSGGESVVMDVDDEIILVIAQGGEGGKSSEIQTGKLAAGGEGGVGTVQVPPDGLHIVYGTAGSLPDGGEAVSAPYYLYAGTPPEYGAGGNGGTSEGEGYPGSDGLVILRW